MELIKLKMEIKSTDVTYHTYKNLFLTKSLKCMFNSYKKSAFPGYQSKIHHLINLHGVMMM